MLLMRRADRGAPQRTIGNAVLQARRPGGSLFSHARPRAGKEPPVMQRWYQLESHRHGKGRWARVGPVHPSREHAKSWARPVTCRSENS